MANNNLPMGFIIAITENKDALKYYQNLDESAQNKISKYIQNSNSSDEAKMKIDISIKGLAKNNLLFLS